MNLQRQLGFAFATVLLVLIGACGGGGGSAGSSSNDSGTLRVALTDAPACGFDAVKSVVRAGNSGNYLLKPVISVTPRFISGVSGFVATTLANGNTTVSLEQAGVVIKSTSPDSSGNFLLQPVSPGTYDLVLTA